MTTKKKEERIIRKCRRLLLQMNISYESFIEFANLHDALTEEEKEILNRAYLEGEFDFRNYRRT